MQLGFLHSVSLQLVEGARGKEVFGNKGSSYGVVSGCEPGRIDNEPGLLARGWARRSDARARVLIQAHIFCSTGIGMERCATSSCVTQSYHPHVSTVEPTLGTGKGKNRNPLRSF